MNILKTLKEYSIVICLIIFQIMVIGFIIQFGGELSTAQGWMLFGVIVISVAIDVWMYFSIRKIKEKAQLEIQVETMRKEQEMEKRSLEVEQMKIRLLEEKRTAFLEALDKMFQLCETESATATLKTAYDDTARCLTNMKLEKYCESTIANAVLTMKHEEAAENDITMKIAIDELRDDIGINRVDICSMMSNLLDNAIEACKKVNGKREIHVRTNIKGGYLSVVVENSCAEKMRRKDNVFWSTKQDAQNHGYGTKILQMIAEKYEGRFYLEKKDDFAKAVVLLKIE